METVVLTLSQQIVNGITFNDAGDAVLQPLVLQAQDGRWRAVPK